MGICTASQKIRTGLQQLMAGSRNFNLSTITRRDLMSLTEECEKVTGIPYVMRAYRKEAEKILRAVTSDKARAGHISPRKPMKIPRPAPAGRGQGEGAPVPDEGAGALCFSSCNRLMSIVSQKRKGPSRRYHP